VPVSHFRLIVEPVRLVSTGANHVRHGIAARDEQLGDQTPVAPRPEGLGAHEARRGLGERLVQGSLPLGGSHPGRVAAKCGNADAGETLFTGLAAAPAPELDGVAVRDSGRSERLRERRLTELGVAPGTRKSPHVHERLDVYFS
jgi:hypothetical protein